MLSSSGEGNAIIMIDHEIIERLAADQASLRAGVGLAKPAKWSALSSGADVALIWGECAGSGARPYRVTPVPHANSPASMLSVSCA